MTEKDIIKKGIAEAEKEAQEKEISKVKMIVKTYLEKIQEKKLVEDKAREERKMLEKDLDDLKGGRLDKIMERQANDPRAREIAIIGIKKIMESYQPMFPWRSPWIVEIKDQSWSYFPADGGGGGGSVTSGYANSNTTVTGYNNNVTYTTTTSSTPSISYSATVGKSPTNAVIYYSDSGSTMNGTIFSSFCGGTYNIDGRIINL